ncbi:MAG TPA: cytochrome c oxidase assembly protein [Solirubrobacterales bacterium]|jgi:hypothetical protein|nr:cytochrome c oxidase assembly protein [Solirubrobacterales bacterium]
MALPGSIGEWELDGAIGLVFSLLTVAVGVVYLAAAEIGHRRDRRSRRWPPGRTACFIGGIAVLLVALDSGIGASADEHLSAHMVEHMLIWLAVAPLLVAGAPIRPPSSPWGRPGGGASPARSTRTRCGPRPARSSRPSSFPPWSSSATSPRSTT